MKNKLIFLWLIAMVFVCLSSCSNEEKKISTKSAVATENQKILNGIPLSEVGNVSDDDNNRFAFFTVVLDIGETKPVVAYRKCDNGTAVTIAEALVEYARLNMSGEKIRLVGNYDREFFVIESIEVNGVTIEF